MGSLLVEDVDSGFLFFPVQGLISSNFGAPSCSPGHPGCNAGFPGFSSSLIDNSDSLRSLFGFLPFLGLRGVPPSSNTALFDGLGGQSSSENWRVGPGWFEGDIIACIEFEVDIGGGVSGATACIVDAATRGGASVKGSDVGMYDIGELFGSLAP